MEDKIYEKRSEYVLFVMVPHYNIYPTRETHSLANSTLETTGYHINRPCLTNIFISMAMLI